MPFNVGDALSGSYDYSDADGDLEGTSTFQWYRADDGVGTNEAAISGATSTTYTVVGADGGKYLRFGVTPVALSGTSPCTEAFSGYSEVNGVLTEIASVTAGSSVSTLSTGAISLSTAKTYFWIAGVDMQAGSTQCDIHFDGNTTNSTYRKGYRSSVNSVGDVSSPPAAINASGGRSSSWGMFTIVNGELYGIDATNGGPSWNLLVEGSWHTGISSVGELELTGNFEAGTYLKLYEMEA